jgi:SAM-dependent methyltransferase
MLPVIKHFVMESLAARPANAGNGYALDVGCGEQPFRSAVEQFGYQYVAMDVQQNSSGSVDVLAPIDSEIADRNLVGKFDLILCTEVLEHVADWFTAFENFKTLLRPGGCVVITSPFLWPLHEEPYDFWRATPHAIRYLANRSGLDVLTAKKGGTPSQALSTALGVTAIKTPSGPLAGLRRGVLAAIRAVAQKFVDGHVPHLFARVDDGLYLSTMAILQKPSDGAGRL